MIKLTATKEVHFVHNTVDYTYTLLGDFFLQPDGYYRFWPDPAMIGYWNGWVLRAIADLEDEINKEWDQHIQDMQYEQMGT